MPTTSRAALLRPPIGVAPAISLVNQLLHWELGLWRLCRWSRVSGHNEMESQGAWKQIHAPRSHPSYHKYTTCAIGSLALSRDGSILASASDDCSIAICDTASGQVLRRLDGHLHEVFCVVTTANGFFSGSYDETIRVWALQDHKPKILPRGAWDYASCQAVEDGRFGMVMALALSGDNRLLASGHKGGAVLLWNVTYEEVDSDLHGEVIRAAVVEAMQEEEVRGMSASGSAHSSNCKRREPRLHLHGKPIIPDTISDVWSLTMTKDATKLVFGTTDGVMHVCLLPMGVMLLCIQAHWRTITGLTLTPNETMVVSTSYDSEVKLWDLNTGEDLAAWQTGGTCQVAVSPDGSLIVTPMLSNRAFGVWDLSVVLVHGFSSATMLWGSHEMVNNITALTFAPDGSRLFIGHGNGEVTCWYPSSRTKHVLEDCHGTVID